MEQVTVSLGERAYEVLVGDQLIDRCGSLVRKYVNPPSVIIVTDENIAGQYLPQVERSLKDEGFSAVATAVVPAGETSKDIHHLARLYDACFAARLERHSCLIALGGGVVGDLAGFCAATYLRGIPFVQMPTTLLAQVDSSVGGKTGINLPGGKNLVGSFHQPRLVLADVAALATLPERQFATGMAEIIKHGLIRDAQLVDWLERNAAEVRRRDGETMTALVARNVRIKADVVAADERESGLRAILNYGHTVGHAIERVAAYGAYTHGEAVALGMVAEAEISRLRGDLGDADCRRQAALLAEFGLPIRLRQGLPIDELISAMAHDKKVVSGKLRFVLPTEIGKVRIADDVTPDELRQAVSVLEAGR